MYCDFLPLVFAQMVRIEIGGDSGGRWDIQQHNLGFLTITRTWYSLHTVRLEFAVREGGYGETSMLNR
jgi:hypothetical protein